MFFNDECLLEKGSESFHMITVICSHIIVVSSMVPTTFQVTPDKDLGVSTQILGMNLTHDGSIKLGIATSEF